MKKTSQALTMKDPARIRAQHNKILHKKALLNKLMAFFLLTVCIVMLTAIPAYAEGTPGNLQQGLGDMLRNQLDSSEAKDIGQQTRKYLGDEIQDILPGFDPDLVLKDLAIGKFELSFTGIMNRCLRFIFNEIYININVLIKLVVLAIFCAVLKNLQTSFLSESVGEIAFFACYVLMVCILLVGFQTALKMAGETIDNMVSFMKSTIPILIVLMVSSGNFVSAGTFQPILIFASELAGMMMKNIMLPLIFTSTVLGVLSNISERVPISKLGDFIKQIGTWAMGAMLSLFIGVVVIQGAVVSNIDGVTSKTAKFAINTLVPVAGKYLADAADMVVGCSLIIKNAAGVLALITVVLISIIPILKVVALILVYRFTAVLIEPVADKRIVKCISDMGGTLSYIFGIMVSVAVMFLISIAAVINSASTAAMIR